MTLTILPSSTEARRTALRKPPTSPLIGLGAMPATRGAHAPTNFEQARNFLTALAPGDDRFTFQTFDDSEAKRPELARVVHGTLAQSFSELSRLSVLGAGVFVTLNRTDLRGRRKANIIAIRALFADLDGAPIPDLASLGLPAHIVVETSTSRFHVHWRVEGLETGDFTGLQARLAALFRGDPTVSDLPRVVRLPGFPHQKNLNNPHMVQFWANKPLAPYEADAFRERLSEAERTGVRQENFKFTAFAGGLSLPPDMNRGYPDGQRTSELLKRVGWCLGPGGKMSEPEAFAACLAWNEFNLPPLPEEKVRSTVASIARKEALKCAVTKQARPIIKVEGGNLSHEADEAEQALIDAGLPIFVRAGLLVSPACEEAPAAKDRKTTIARLRKLSVDGIIDRLSRYADFQRYDARTRKLVSIDPPERVAKIILSRAGVGKFPQVAGVITTRPFGLTAQSSPSRVMILQPASTLHSILNLECR
jgi:hypothetical protein